MPNKVAMRPDVPHKLLAKLIEAMKAKGVRRGKERDFVRLAERHLSEVRRSVAIATAFAFLCWAWHVRCHVHGSVLSSVFGFLRRTARNCILEIHKKPVKDRFPD